MAKNKLGVIVGANRRDGQGHVSDDSVRKFLKASIDQFAAFAGRLAPQRAADAA